MQQNRFNSFRELRQYMAKEEYEKKKRENEQNRIVWKQSQRKCEELSVEEHKRIAALTSLMEKLQLPAINHADHAMGYNWCFEQFLLRAMRIYPIDGQFYLELKAQRDGDLTKITELLSEHKKIAGSHEMSRKKIAVEQTTKKKQYYGNKGKSQKKKSKKQKNGHHELEQQSALKVICGADGTVLGIRPIDDNRPLVTGEGLKEEGFDYWNHTGTMADNLDYRDCQDFYDRYS